MSVAFSFRTPVAILSFLVAGAAIGFPAAGAAPLDGLETPRLLARHGEPYSAWTLLGRGDGGGDDSRVMLEVRLLTELERYAEADSLLEHHAPLLVDRDIFRHTLQRARLSFLAGHSERALDLIVGIDSVENDSLSPYRDMLRIDVLLSLGDAEGAVTVAEALVKRGVPDALGLSVDEALMEGYYLSGRTAEGVDLSHRIQRSTRDDRARARVLSSEYEVHVKLQDFDAARATALMLVQKHPRFKDTRRIAEEAVRDIGANAMSVEELIAYASFLTRRGDYDGAERLFRALNSRSLKASQRETSRIERAEFHYRRGDYERAIELAKAPFQDPSHRRRSMLILARAYRQGKRPADAARMYEFYVKTYPNDAKAAEALYVASGIYERASNHQAQERVLRSLRQSYPSSYFGRAASLTSAEMYVSEGEYGAAISVLRQRVKRSRRTDEAALFYLADVYRSAGDAQNNELILNELARLNPYSFYVNPTIAEGSPWTLMQGNGALLMEGDAGLLGFLAASVERKQQSWTRVREALADGAIGGAPSPEHDACMARGRWFLGAGFRDWGEGELEAARRRCLDSPVGMLELAGLYDEYAMPWRSVRLYGNVRDRMRWKVRREYADDVRQLMFPVPFPVQVLENASRHRLPPHLVYALIREESRFDADAVSRVGALGLMQLMPETGRYVARQMELPEWGEDDLLDPEINVTLGVWYAATLSEQGQGDYLWMLAAYNAGARNARRWFEDADQDVVRAVDGIDYKETRDYVRRIVESANVYRDLYFSGRQVGGTQ